MRKALVILVSLVAFCAAVSIVITQRRVLASEGYVIERDRDVARNESGPHNGGGPSTGYIFFEKIPDLKFSFRKRVLHPGAAIGYHLQKTDEVYYILSGVGRMTINNSRFMVKSGDAILTRGGSSHGLEQTGKSDLTIVITFQK